MFQVCVKHRRKRDEPMEGTCLDFDFVKDKTMARLYQAAEETEKLKGVLVKPPSMPTPTPTPTPMPKPTTTPTPTTTISTSTTTPQR